MEIQMRGMITGLALALTTVGTAPAAAAPALTRSVSFADLNLSTNEGEAELEQRIKRAAEDICIERSDRDLLQQLLAHDCYKAAVADGTQQMRNIIASNGIASAAAATIMIVGQ
jgi:UrcA family protein